MKTESAVKSSEDGPKVVSRSGFNLAHSLTRNRTAALLLLAQLATAGGSFLVNILSARALGPSARGELALFLQIAYAANLLCLLSRHRALLRYPPSDQAISGSIRDARRLSTLPMLASAAVAIVVGLSFKQWHLAAALLMIAFFVKMSSGVTVNMHRAAAIAAQSARPFLTATGASQALLISGSAAFVVGHIERPEPWLLLYGLTASAPYLVVEYIATRHKGSHGRDKRELAAVSRLGMRLLPASLAEAVLSRCDRFLIPLFSTYAQLGIYAVVLTMTDLISWPANQYAQSRIPAWRAAYDEARLHWVRTLAKVLALSLGVATPMSTAIYLLIVPIFGEEYAGSLALVLPLTLVAVLQCIITFGVSMGVAVDSPATATTISMTGTGAAIPALVFLIPKYGALGAAWAMVIGYFVASLVALVCMTYVTRSGNGHRRRLTSSRGVTDAAEN